MSSIFEHLLQIILMIILPVQIYLLLVGGFILLDTFYRFRVIFKKKDKFSFKKLFDGLTKKMFNYTPIVIAIFYMDLGILNSVYEAFGIPLTFIFTKIATTICIGKELNSMSLSHKILTGKTYLDEMKIWWKNIKKVKKEYDDFK